MTPSKPLELQKAVTAALRSVHPRVFHESAPKGTLYPYLIFWLPTSHDDGSLEQYVLDIDGWDRPENIGDAVPLETLMHHVDLAIHKMVVVVDGLSAVFYREARIPMDEEDPQLLRRKYIYSIRTYETRRKYHG